MEPGRTKKIKNILRTFEAENRQNFKNIQPEPKKPGSYKKKKCNATFPCDLRSHCGFNV